MASYTIVAGTPAILDPVNQTNSSYLVQTLVEQTCPSPILSSFRTASDSLHQSVPSMQPFAPSQLAVIHVFTTISAYCIVAFVVYVVALIINRLYLSPIASFPGPLLPKLTYLYEFYYNYVQDGVYWLKVDEMHQKYGPVVRVSPTELHIRDLYYYNELYVTAAVRKTDIDTRFGQGSGFEDMVAVSVPHDRHRRVRQPMERFFSRPGLSSVEGRIETIVRKLCARLAGEKGSGRILNLSHAFNSLAVDAVSSTMFEEPTDYLGDPDFNRAWWERLNHGTKSMFLFKHFPLLMRIVAAKVIRYFTERTTNWRVWDDKARRQILITQLRPSDEANTRSDTTFFDHLAHSDVAAADLGGPGGYARLAQLFSQAGSHQLQLTLSNIVTHVLLDNEKEEKLRAEIAPFFADGKSEPHWGDLEKAPYLSACVKEGLRLAMGVLNRSARISPDVDTQFNEWTIPKGTPVSMSSHYMHRNPTAFPSPHDFIPERWMTEDLEQLKLMRRLYVPFARGSRSCLAVNLSPMIIFLTLAHLFRPDAARIVLHETDKTDVELVRGYLFSMPKSDSQGVRAKII